MSADENRTAGRARAANGTAASRWRRRPLRAHVLAAMLVVGTVLAPVAIVADATPSVAADCGQYGFLCSATLTASTSAAKVSTPMTITIDSHAGNDQCIQLTDGGAGSDIPNSDTTTPSSGILAWTVRGPSDPKTVTYTAFYRGSSSANNCPASPPYGVDPDVPFLATVQVTWVAIGPDQNSTATAAPRTVIADGQSTATVTVVLTDPSGLAIPGQSVRLNNTGSAQVAPLTATSGPGGQAVFTLTDNTAETLTIGATRNGISLDARAALEFVSLPQAERALSTVTASLLRVPADGLSTSTITVTAKDSSGPVPGRTINLTASSQSAQIHPLASQTNGLGQIGFTVTDTADEVVTFSALDGGSELGSVGVRFGSVAAGEQGSSFLSLTPSGDVSDAATLPDDGTTAAAVYVQLRCLDNNLDACNAAGTVMYGQFGDPTATVAGARVKLVPTSATSATVTEILNPTNFNGEARFLVTDTVPEQVTFNAVDVSNNVQLADVSNGTVTPRKVTLTFTGPGTPSATTSTATASPGSVAADGVTASTVTVTLRDANRIPVPDKTVTLSPGAGHATFTPAQSVTDPRGVTTFSTVDTQAETVSFFVTDVTDNVALTTFPQVTFTAGAPSSSASTVTASPQSVTADGRSTSTITVTITDVNGGAVSGKTVALAQGGGQSTITGPSGPTDAQGTATFTATDATPEAVTYTATDVTDGFDLSHSATVTFTGKPTSSNSTISADPASVPANNIATSTVVVTVRDTNNSPVAGKLITLRPGGGQSRFTPVTPGSDTSNDSGAATFAVSDGFSETITYSAVDATDGISLQATTSVSFTGSPSGSASTVTANPGAVPADGTAASTITVTILDGAGQPIPGQNITLSGSNGTRSSITAVTNPTNASGVATFTVTDQTPESVTYSATDTSVNPAQQIFSTAQVVFGATLAPSVSSVSPSYGPSTGGTKVTISGANLGTATGVQFGTTLVTRFSVNKKTGAVTVTSPPGKDIVDVQVVTPAGTTAPVPADLFRYAPAVSGVSPARGPSAGGTEVTISGTNLDDVTAVTFGDTPAASFNVSKKGTLTAVSPPGTAAVDVRVTAGGGKSADSPSDKFTYT